MLLVIMAVTAMAQKINYQVVAICPRNMQTQDYGKVTVSDIKIVKDSDAVITIDGRQYTVVSKDRDIKSDSIESYQYTTKDAFGGQNIITFNHDYYNPVELMKYQVIFFDANHPYGWTYYFCRKPKPADK